MTITATIMNNNCKLNTMYMCIYGYFLEDFETDVKCSALQSVFVSNWYVEFLIFYLFFFENHLLGMPMVAEQKSNATSIAFYRRGSWTGTGDSLTRKTHM